MLMFFRKKNGQRGGFTLIELLLTSLLLVWVGLGVYRSFSSGLAVWKRIAAYRSNSATNILFEAMARDLRNYGDVQKVSFAGSKDRISFLKHNTEYLIDKAPTDRSVLDPKDVINRVEYVFDAAKKELKRRVYEFGSNVPRADTTALRNVESVNFSFYLSDPANNRITKVLFVQDVVPKSVEVMVEYRNSAGEVSQCRRFIDIPLVK